MKMKVEIWTDVLCPWCYIGKREFENALSGFKRKSEVEVVWKSFELDPTAQKDYEGTLYDLLASKYNISIEKAKSMTAALVERAQNAGLHYNMDIAQATNSFNAHRLIHLAVEYGVQNQVIEKLSAAYLTEGKHIGHNDTLIELGEEAGLDRSAISIMLNSSQFADKVRADEYEARTLGIRGVPFFLFGGKYSISGAQPQEAFAEALEKIWDELHTGIVVENDGPSCNTSEEC